MELPHLHALIAATPRTWPDAVDYASDALREMIDDTTTSTRALGRLPNRSDLVQYVRALRWHRYADELHTRVTKRQGGVSCVLDKLWLIEAFLNLSEAKIWFDGPFNEITNRQFPSLGVGPMWVFDAPVVSFTSLELLLQLEFLTWALVDQFRKKARTSEWLIEFELLFELTRARAQVICTQSLPEEMILEQHRYLIVGARDDAVRLDDYDGRSDDEVEDGPNRGGDVDLDLGENLANASHTYIFEVVNYIHAIELELLRAKMLGCTGETRVAVHGTASTRVALLRGIAELDQFATLHAFSEYACSTMVLPCDLCIYSSRFRSQDPTASELLSAKNQAMSDIEEQTVEEVARKYVSLFGDYMMHAHLRYHDVPEPIVQPLPIHLPTANPTIAQIYKCTVLDVFCVVTPTVGWTNVFVFSSLVAAIVWLNERHILPWNVKIPTTNDGVLP